MHRKHLQTILLAAAISPVGRKHNMSADEIHAGIVQLRPTWDAGLVRAAASLAATPPPPKAL